METLQSVKKTDPVKITILDYDKQHFHEEEVKTVEVPHLLKDKPTVIWINVDGLRAETIEKISESFDLHPLVSEAILNRDQRPKIEDFGNYIYIVLKMLSYNDKTTEIETEQVSLILGSNFVISFQEEREGDVFSSIRGRIKSEKASQMKEMGADYLAYSLIDAIVDSYFIILEKLGERIEFMEEELVTNPTPSVLQKIHELKREIISLRKSVWPLREVISGLERGESTLIEKKSVAYFRNLYDHTIQVIDTVETSRDIISGMLDIYLSSISNKMNEVMKVLTIIATIFMPLTLMAGIYGMNFKYMPELESPLAYPMVWLAMLSIGGVMLFYFRKKRWI